MAAAATSPTVTDADVLLGYVPADYFLGGEIKLDAERSRQAIRKVAEPLKMTESQAAQAIFNIVNSLMADQVIELSTKRGYDVRDFALIVGGGAGAVHGAHIAELLGIPNVIIPKYAALTAPSACSRWTSAASIRRTSWRAIDKLDRAQLESRFRDLTALAAADLKGSHAKLPIPAAIGLPACLAAVNGHAVEQLVVPDDVLVPGYVCGRCGLPGVAADGCPDWEKAAQPVAGPDR